MTCWVELASDNRVSRELDSELIHLIVASNQNGQKQESNTQVHVHVVDTRICNQAYNTSTVRVSLNTCMYTRYKILKYTYGTPVYDF